MNQELPQLHRIGEFLRRTGLSRSTAYREIAAGRLRITRIGRSVRISEEEIGRYIANAESAATSEERQRL